MFGTARHTGSAPLELGTRIGPGLTVEGRLCFRGAIRIDGTVRGPVSVPVDGEGALFVGTAGSIEGDVRASEVTVDGRIGGSVFATGKVVIGPAGRVAGEVHGHTVELAPGAMVGPSDDRPPAAPAQPMQAAR